MDFPSSFPSPVGHSFSLTLLGSARLGGAESAVLPVRRGSSPAGNQASFFHEAVSVEERLWISPAASASDTSCCTSGNMTSALPSQLTAPERTTLYLMTRRLQSDLSRRYGLRGCESSVRFFFFDAPSLTVGFGNTRLLNCTAGLFWNPTEIHVGVNTLLYHRSSQKQTSIHLSVLHHYQAGLEPSPAQNPPPQKSRNDIQKPGLQTAEAG